MNVKIKANCQIYLGYVQNYNTKKAENLKKKS